MGSRFIVLIATLALLLAPAHSVRAADLMKHSGVIVDFDGKTDTIVVAEVGPRRVPDGATVITYQRIALTPETQFAIVFRTEGRMRFAGDFVESPLERAGVYVDDSVTVECRHERGRMIALKITVVDLPGGAFQKESGR